VKNCIKWFALQIKVCINNQSLYKYKFISVNLFQGIEKCLLAYYLLAFQVKTCINWSAMNLSRYKYHALFHFQAPDGWYLRMTVEELHLTDNNLNRCYHWLEIQYNLPGQTGIKSVFIFPISLKQPTCSHPKKMSLRNIDCFFAILAL
jgi:hypothetical protein